ERAISLFIEEGNAAAVAEASSHLCYIHLWNVDDSRALTVVDRALSLLGSDISPSRHRLLLCKALSLSVGHTEASLATLSEAKLIEAALLEARADGFASMCEARVAWGSAQFDWADQCAREAMARFRATGNLWGEAELFEPIAAALCLGRPT